LLEAMASGLPLIASDVPGNRDWLTSENALFFKSGDDKALSQVFLQLYENNELRLRMAHSNHIRALAEFDNQQFLKRYAKLYSEVLSRPELALP